jgi:predicted GNAT family acetyltransferase
MNDIHLKLDEQNRGAFQIEEDGDRLAFMEIAITGNNLTVYHTEVSEKLRGQGIALSLVSALVDYARKNKLKVIALCPYVRSQFSKNPGQYADIWNQHWH